MGWLEDYLAAAQTRRNALMDAAADDAPTGFRDLMPQAGLAAPHGKGFRAIAPTATINAPQAPGQAGMPDPSRTVEGTSVFLGRGSAPQKVGAARVDSPYERFAVKRGD